MKERSKTSYKTRHGAVIKVSKSLLLKWLDFEGGTIHRTYEPEPYLEPDHFCIVLEHPDLPEVGQNEQLPEICPIFQIYADENGSIIKVERVDPKKTRPVE